MAFNSSAARAAFFKKLKEDQDSSSTLAADITAKLPSIDKLSKVSNTSKPMKFKKIRSYMKG